jgi:hypothetical protein
VEAQIAYLFTIREGRILRLESFGSLDDALRAARGGDA